MDPQCSVVVVDDAPEVRGLVRTQLRLSGRYAVVAEGSDGRAAIELCREHQPDILLLDVSMPDMDGIAALPDIREIAPRTSIVMYTGFDGSGLAERARALGATALIEKSSAIARLADQLDAIRANGGAAPGSPSEHEPTEEIDTSVLTEHLERFREVFEEAAIGMATMTLTGRVVRANKALAELVGEQVQALVGTPYATLAPQHQHTAIDAALRRAQDGRGAVVQFEHDLASGAEPLRVLATAAPVRDARGHPLYLFLQSQDVTAQRRAEAELGQVEQRFRLLVEAVRDYAIFMLDPDGRVISWNAGAQRIKGYREEEIVGRHFRTFYPPEVQASGHPEHELELARANGSYEEEGWRVRKDGSYFWASVVITAVYDHEGRHVGFAKVTRNMDERRQMLIDAEQAAEALARANDELATANDRLAQEAAEQAQFLAVTAHELRSPIGVLAGSAQLLVEHLAELTEAERAELADAVRSSTGRLQRLLRDLLTAARLEAKAVRIELQDVDLGALLNRTVAAARAAHPDSVIELTAPAGLQVRGEADRLAQAVDNLIENALRHGRPPVVVAAEHRDQQVLITVGDAGPGVPEELRGRLFERFASGGRRSGTGGTGLGLFIVRELARAHGGDAWYDPDLPGGHRFVLSLPAAPPTGNAPPAAMP